MNIINVAELKSHLSEVLAQVNKTGDAVVIGRYGVPVAQITPYIEQPLPQRKAGFAKHLLMCEQTNLQQQADAATDTASMDGFYS